VSSFNLDIHFSFDSKMGNFSSSSIEKTLIRIICYKHNKFPDFQCNIIWNRKILLCIIQKSTGFHSCISAGIGGKHLKPFIIFAIGLGIRSNDYDTIVFPCILNRNQAI